MRLVFIFMQYPKHGRKPTLRMQIVYNNFLHKQSTRNQKNTKNKSFLFSNIKSNDTFNIKKKWAFLNIGSTNKFPPFFYKKLSIYCERMVHNVLFKVKPSLLFPILLVACGYRIGRTLHLLRLSNHRYNFWYLHLM